MKRFFSTRFVAAVVLAVAAFGAASTAQARPDVQVTIGLPGFPIFLPPPVIVRAEPVFVPPRQVYAPPPVVVFERDWRPGYHYEYARERGWRHREWQRQEWERREWERREWERREWERRQRHDRDDHGRGRD